MKILWCYWVSWRQKTKILKDARDQERDLICIKQSKLRLAERKEDDRVCIEAEKILIKEDQMCINEENVRLEQFLHEERVTNMGISRMP